MGPPCSLLAAKISVRFKRLLQVRRGEVDDHILCEWGLEDLGIKLLDGRFRERKVDEWEADEDEAYDVLVRQRGRSAIV
jgi:hypothetical protein